MFPVCDRAVHWLRPNAHTSIPHNLVFVTTYPARDPLNDGDKGESHQLMVGCAEHVRMVKGRPARWQRIVFYRADDFWQWLDRFRNPKHSLWILGYRLGYDFTLLHGWELIEQDYLNLHWDGTRPMPRHQGEAAQKFMGFLCLSDPPFIVKCKCAEQTYTLVDLRNYWACSLEALAGTVGMELNNPPGDAAEKDEVENFCIRRVQVMQAAFCGLLQRWQKSDLGEFKYTAAGLAWHAYRHRSMRRKSILIDDSQRARDLERESLVGGECRCFFIGQVVPPAELARLPESKKPSYRSAVRPGPVYGLDVTACYGAMMQANYFPRRLIAFKEQGSAADVSAWHPYLCLIARVELDTFKHTYPVKINGERWYAQGQFWTTLAGPELLRAYFAGEIKSYGAIAAYERGKLFEGFMAHWWNERRKCEEAKDLPGSLLAKLMMNALAGKFAQQDVRWEDAQERVYWPRWGVFAQGLDGKPSELATRVVGGYVQREQVPRETKDSFPAITAYVTSYARVHMAELRTIAGPSNVFYQDTDSLHVTERGFTNLDLADKIADGQLGKLRLTGIVPRVVYRGLKDYVWGEEHCIAGLKTGAVEVEPDRWEIELWEGPQSIIARGPDGTVRTRRETFRTGRLHYRGELLPDGSVAPVTLPWQESPEASRKEDTTGPHSASIPPLTDGLYSLLEPSHSEEPRSGS